MAGDNEEFDQIVICRAIYEGNRGYMVTYPNGAKAFCFSLSMAFREVLLGLAHNKDRDIMVVGEPERGNAW
jgi:hypothetical protein